MGLDNMFMCCLLVVLIFVKHGESQGSFDIDDAVAAVASSASLMRPSYFHNYSYDDTNQMSIVDGGLNMYDTGNKIRIFVNASATKIQYGQTYRDKTSVFSSVATHPFVALWWIEKSQSTKYVMEVTSNFGSDSAGSSDTFQDSFVSGHTMVDVVGFQLYKAESNLSICEVFFFVKNLNSQMNSSSARLLFHNSPTNPGSDSVHMGILTGDMFNQVLFGYTLLSKRGGGVVTKLEIRTTVKAIVESISSQVGPTTTEVTSVMTTSSSDIGSSSGDGTTQAVDATVAQSGTVTSPTPIFSVTEMTKDLKQVLRSDDLSRGIAEFHRYSYDDSSANRISDGGNDMYDTGNMVYFTVNGIRTRAEYDRTYDGLGYTFSSVSVYPFVAFFVIDKDHTDAEPKNYSIQVISNLGADGGGYFHSENGTVTAGNYTLSYYTAQVYDAGDPSICEVYFHIRHNQTPEDANLKLNFTIPTRARQDMKNYVNRTGSKEPGILGYMLLSKYSTKVFTSEVRGILTDLLTDLSQRATILNSALYRTAENMKQRLLSSDLTKHLPDFFPYEYDDRSYPINSISDSSSDMYDTGNKVSFGIDDGNLVLAEYNQTYRRQPGFSFSVLAIHPFIAFFYINTTGEIDRNYTLQVASNLGADGTGSYQNFSGSVSGGGYVLSFHGAQVYGSGDASVCEVYFFISQNPGGKNFAFESPIRDRGMMRNTARLSGNIDEAVLGYTLLSTFTPGRQITQDELEATMLSTLSAIIGQEIMETTALATTQESFSQSTPATPTIPIQQNAAEISANLLNRFRSFDLTRYIHDFYRYKYDDITDPVNKINDGGSDMYDNGNEIYFTSNGLRTFAEYNQTYNLGYSFSTLAIHPFIAFFYINSNGRESAPYTIEVSSNLGADGNGNMRDFSGYVILGKFFLEFRGVQVYGANDASVCEVYFYTSRQGKNRGVFTLSSPLTSTNEINSVARLDGNIDESVFGYILLSTEDPGRQLTLSEIEATMRGVLELIVDLPTTGSNASTGAAEIPNVTTSPLSFNVTTSSVESNATDAIATEKSWKVDDVVDRIRSTNLIGHITDFHRYIYRTNENEIYDGGNDMYDYGNKVYFTVNGVQTRATYARTYNGSTYSFTSITGYPFVAFFTIDKIPDSAQAMNYSIQVISNLGADGHGIFLRFGDRISIGEYTVRYKAAEVAESSDATVCEVYFHIYQEASGTLNFTTPIRDRQNMKNFLNLTESREAAILGYVLLAKPNGARVSSSEVRTTMTNLLRTVTSSFEVTETALTEAVNSLVQRFRATNLTRRVTDFHRYTYDDRTPLINQISDGGDDMYDGGNQVYFEANHVETLADYHRTYRSQDYIFSILPHHPFIAFFYINSTDGENENFSIRVNSNLGADGSGTFQNFSGSVSLAVHQLSFHGVQVFRAGDASVCEVFFHVSLPGSGEAFTFTSPQRDRREIHSKAVLSGNISEAVLGYMMLSTEDPGRQITQDELEATMLDTLSVIFDQEALQNTTVTPEAGIAKKSHQEQIADVTYVLLTRLRYANVTQNIPEFHTYVYDDIYAPVNKMSDGGNDMFDTGNKVYFTVDGKETLATYNETYTGPDYTFSTIANHPFIAMFYINLTEPSNKTFSIRLSSNLGADGSGTFHNFSGSVSLGGYQLFFSGVQVYGAGDASVCEVFFYVLKNQSGGNFLFSSPSQARSNLESTAQLYGITDEAILGYMLLSTKSPGLKITQDQLETTMRMTLGVILGQFVAPTEPPAESPQRQAITEATNSLLNRLQSSNLTKFIPDFHRYTYDTRYTSSIPDGGDDMFDTGNMVYISVNGNETLVNYNKTYYGLDYSFSTLAIHPFVAFFYINSTGEESGNFSIRVNSDLGADGSGTFQNFSGSVSLAVHQLSFHGVQVFGAGDASVCEVFFHVTLVIFQKI
uniref:Uncharacterized protein LOC104266555 n=1 Tax=Phallusia mammillata TaxID=59560 RepID=A0A6F9DJV3_9ASCI|nr:uncharacterized protein LOC104266555 [Phallusia mammillata]